LESAPYFGAIDLLDWIWKSQVAGSRRVSSKLRHVEGRRNVTTTNSWYKRLIMKILISLLSIVLLATSLVAQDAPIPQDLPLQLRQTGEAVRRSVERPIPQHFPFAAANEEVG
jgi:hypothetical protein